MKKKKYKKRAVAALLLAALCAVYLWYENTALTVTEYTVCGEEVPAGFDGFVIAQVSDFHNSHNSLLNDALAEALEQCEPDIIVLTGDMIDSGRTDVDATVAFVERIKDIAPVYYVIGNHESRTGEYYRLAKELRSMGVSVMNNHAVTLRLGDSELSLLGINDPKLAHELSVHDAAIVSKELEQLEYDSSLYTILLSHRPELLDVYRRFGINLVFAGHAHGGLVRLPLIGGLFAPNQGFFPTYTSGVYREGDTEMIVSRGVGNSGYSLRVNNRPELVVVTLGTDE